MKELFFKVLELSLSGSIVILAVMVLRLVLRKAPKRIFCLLWLLVCLRLTVPFEIRSNFSLQPELNAVISDTLPDGDTAVWVGESGIMQGASMEPPEIQQPVINQAPAEQPDSAQTTTPVTVNYTAILALLWAVGTAGMLVYSVVSYAKLKQRVRTAVIVEEGVWACAGLDTAFVLGFFRPRIYLPVGLKKEEQQLILTHERVHIARLDHWSRPLAFAVLAVHWFNPLVWAAFILLCRDMEMACDETVIRAMTLDERKAYSAALLCCSSRNHRIAACPVAFGEISVKRRIVNVIRYRKKSIWVILTAVIAAALLAACFMTDPMPEETEPPASENVQPTDAVESEPAALASGFEDYVCKYTDPRDLAWEEDIVYLASTYLTEFPKFTQTQYFESRNYGNYSGLYLVTDNRAYDEALRAEFISQIYDLIELIPQRSDTQLRLEVDRVVNLIGTGGCSVKWEVEEFFPLVVKPLEQDGKQGLYLMRTIEAYEDLLYARLTAINDIPVEDVMEILLPYMSRESTYFAQNCLVNYGLGSGIVQKPLLQTAGIMAQDTNQAEFTFVLENGAVSTVMIDAMSIDDYNSDSFVRGDPQSFAFGYEGEQNYWYEADAGHGMLYVCIERCSEHGDYSFQSFLWEVTDILNGAQEPMKLVIDIRGNTGGTWPMSGFEDFLTRLPKVQTSGIYCLVDSGTFFSTWMVSQIREVTDVTVVGTPTGGCLNNWTNSAEKESPNGNLTFYLATQLWKFADVPEGQVLIPDITVYQNLEDYRQGNDTVLAYVAELEK